MKSTDKTGENKMDKYELINKIGKEGHSFPHYDTCNTCVGDFDDVCEWERNRILKILKYFGNKWEVAEESGEVSGEFEYKQFKETVLFKSLKIAVSTGDSK